MAREPTKPHLSRAGHDMHSKNKAVRREAAEVMALAPRGPHRSKSKSGKKR
jgi:hypothetical protein